MNKELGKLLKTYNDHMAKSFVTPFTVSVMTKQRKSLYVGNTFKGEDILKESEAYLKYIECAMLKPSSCFEELLSYITATHTVIEDADSGVKEEVLNMEEGILNDLWQTYKKNPYKYGYKIKHVKNAIEDIIKEKEELSSDGKAV